MEVFQFGRCEIFKDALLKKLDEQYEILKKLDEQDEILKKLDEVMNRMRYFMMRNMIKQRLLCFMAEKWTVVISELQLANTN